MRINSSSQGSQPSTDPTQTEFPFTSPVLDISNLEPTVQTRFRDPEIGSDLS